MCILSQHKGRVSHLNVTKERLCWPVTCVLHSDAASLQYICLQQDTFTVFTIYLENCLDSYSQLLLSRYRPTSWINSPDQEHAAVNAEKNQYKRGREKDTKLKVTDSAHFFLGLYWSNLAWFPVQDNLYNIFYNLSVYSCGLLLVLRMPVSPKTWTKICDMSVSI